MKKRSGVASRDRRMTERPQKDDRQACPFCRIGVLIFDDTHCLEMVAAPAWICDNTECGYRVLVRRNSKPKQGTLSSKELIRSSRQTEAEARRAVMRSKARLDRARRSVDRGTRRVSENAKRKNKNS